MKPATPAPHSAPERGRETGSKTRDDIETDDAKSEDSRAPLPHETDQSVQSQDDRESREAGKQAHEDIERGIVDTDRRGGSVYQSEIESETQRDESIDTDSESAPPK